MNIHTLSTIPGFKNKPPRWELLRRHFGDDEFHSQVIFDLYGEYLAAYVLEHEGPEYSKWKLEMASLTVPLIQDGRLIYAMETLRKRLDGLCDDKEYDFAKSLIDERNSVGLDRQLVNLVACVFGSTNFAYDSGLGTFMNRLLNCMCPASNPSGNRSFMQFDWPDTTRLYKIRDMMEAYFLDDFRKQCFPCQTGLNLHDLCQKHGMDSRYINETNDVYQMLAKVKT
jgi:hypothetical protein